MYCFAKSKEISTIEESNFPEYVARNVIMVLNQANLGEIAQNAVPFWRRNLLMTQQ